MTAWLWVIGVFSFVWPCVVAALLQKEVNRVFVEDHAKIVKVYGHVLRLEKELDQLKSRCKEMKEQLNQKGVVAKWMDV